MTVLMESEVSVHFHLYRCMPMYFYAGVASSYKLYELLPLMISIRRSQSLASKDVATIN